jgi:16S rRNA (cytidine1402-2'-O)-methyltransferase
MNTAPPSRNGTLVLVPNTLDLATETTDVQDVLPLGVLRRAAALTHWIAENAKSTRAFLKRVDAVVPLAQSLQQIAIVELPRPRKGTPTAVHTTDAELRPLLAPALQGDDVGLISEAGLPGVADPGAAVVELAHRLHLPVLALPGPSSLVLALAASGLNGQSFAFAGYLPVDAGERLARVRTLEALSRQQRQTQLVIETPYRNSALLAALLDALAPSTLLSISCGLTLADGWSRTQSVAQWRAERPAMPDRWPAVFGWLAS